MGDADDSVVLDSPTAKSHGDSKKAMLFVCVPLSNLWRSKSADYYGSLAAADGRPASQDPSPSEQTTTLSFKTPTLN
ncbi:MAG: hypothetical protein E5X53_18140 [Mesorhizobium sp.]|uniref:hypothetical protein n=1 Tax=Mesorhizobium sp. TaxID=1871066 RepID=UPI000FE8BB5B|nr:hypothetical protein [Mesorhizobium sp.]RWM16399.1 MAG: hypothetical protein EOR73_22545 [Mesorhizobium sp.]TIP72419.1 MAG: hypothetical protein E5X55_18470 [Mesorhizobium sp.]TIQ11437.1 MAG: hypothetical protein E5X57_17810 [Mesorhizobium sp.]TIR50868.1 MAG: hypothetical protein E5X53_18140 [Mesorhizobium sp.]TJV96591.1 MAG: hypothetical protein E5X52_18405 [Mesorhizobium sp.]